MKQPLRFSGSPTSLVADVDSRRTVSSASADLISACPEYAKQPLRFSGSPTSLSGSPTSLVVKCCRFLRVT